MNLDAAIRRIRANCLAVNGSIRGHCREVVLAICQSLSADQLPVCICYGQYRGEGHHWLRIDDVIIDPTHDQFDPSLPVRRIKESTNSGYIEDGFIYYNPAAITGLS